MVKSSTESKVDPADATVLLPKEFIQLHHIADWKEAKGKPDAGKK